MKVTSKATYVVTMELDGTDVRRMRDMAEAVYSKTKGDKGDMSLIMFARRVEHELHKAWDDMVGRD